MSYITLAEAKTWLGVTGTTEDAVLGDIIAAVDGAIDNFCDVKFAETTVENEIHDARRSDTLVPKHWPIRSVQAVRIGVNADGTGGSVIPATDYTVSEEAIRFRHLTMSQQRGYIALDYKHGLDGVPQPVKMAARLSVEGYYRMRARKSVGVVSKAKEGESISYSGAWHGQSGLPNEAVALLRDYRLVDFPGGSMATRNK